MRVLRLLIVVLLATSLSLLPVSAVMAMTHTANAEMTMSAFSENGGDDCPCCSAAGKCSTNICTLKCFSVPGVLIEGLPGAQPSPQLFVDVGGATMSPFSPRPDPPPPRF